MSTPTSAKKAPLKLLEWLDDNVTFEDIMYELHVLQKIERGLQDAEEGRIPSHEDAKDRLDQWLNR